MAKLLKIFFLAQLLSLTVWAIYSFYGQWPLLILTLIVNSLIWFIFWICSNYILEASSKLVSGSRWDFVRSLTLFYFSILPMEIGALVASSLRFIIASTITQVPIKSGRSIIETIMAPTDFDSFLTYLFSALGILLSFPLIYMLSTNLGVQDPKKTSLKIISVWAFLILLLGPLLSFFS